MSGDGRAGEDGARKFVVKGPEDGHTDSGIPPSTLLPYIPLPVIPLPVFLQTRAAGTGFALRAHVGNLTELACIWLPIRLRPNPSSFTVAIAGDTARQYAHREYDPRNIESVIYWVNARRQRLGLPMIGVPDGDDQVDVPITTSVPALPEMGAILAYDPLTGCCRQNL